MPLEVEKCVRRILPQIKKQYPEKTPSEQEQAAWAICTSLYNQGKLTRGGEEIKL